VPGPTSILQAADFGPYDRLMLDGYFRTLLQATWAQPLMGVQKRKRVARGNSTCLVARVSDADPLPVPNHTQIDSLQAHAGAVGRRVVHQDDLIRIWSVLTNRSQGADDFVAFIVRGDDNGYSR